MPLVFTGKVVPNDLDGQSLQAGDAAGNQVAVQVLGDVYDDIDMDHIQKIASVKFDDGQATQKGGFTIVTLKKSDFS